MILLMHDYLERFTQLLFFSHGKQILGINGQNRERIFFYWYSMLAVSSQTGFYTRSQ